MPISRAGQKRSFSEDSSSSQAPSANRQRVDGSSSSTEERINTVSSSRLQQIDRSSSSKQERADGSSPSNSNTTLIETSYTRKTDKTILTQIFSFSRANYAPLSKELRDMQRARDNEILNSFFKSQNILTERPASLGALHQILIEIGRITDNQLTSIKARTSPFSVERFNTLLEQGQTNHNRELMQIWEQIKEQIRATPEIANITTAAQVRTWMAAPVNQENLFITVTQLDLSNINRTILPSAVQFLIDLL